MRPPPTLHPPIRPGRRHTVSRGALRAEGDSIARSSGRAIRVASPARAARAADRPARPCRRLSPAGRRAGRRCHRCDGIAVLAAGPGAGRWRGQIRTVAAGWDGGPGGDGGSSRPAGPGGVPGCGARAVAAIQRPPRSGKGKPVTRSPPLPYRMWTPAAAGPAGYGALTDPPFPAIRRVGPGGAASGSLAGRARQAIMMSSPAGGHSVFGSESCQCLQLGKPPWSGKGHPMTQSPASDGLGGNYWQYVAQVAAFQKSRKSA